MLHATSHLISDVFYLKIAITCKNFFLSLVVVRLVIFSNTKYRAGTFNNATTQPTEACPLQSSFIVSFVIL